MNRTRQTLDLSRREFSERIRSRPFQVVMGITLVLLVAVVTIIGVASDDEGPTRIGVTDAVDEPTVVLLEATAVGLELDIAVERYADRSTAEQELIAGDVAAVYTGDTLIWKSRQSPTLRSLVTAAATAAQVEETAADLGLGPDELAHLLAPAAIEQTILEPPEDDEQPRQIAAFIGLFLVYMAIIIFGQFVAMGVMEEKQNRVVEVVLSRVSPEQVLASKVAGIGALGLIQLVVLGGATIIALRVVDLEVASLPSIGVDTVVATVLWFLLGYTLYAVLYAALGATVSRQEDLQGALMLPVLVLVPGFFVAQVAVESPDGILAVIGSYFPLWSPMVMPVRSAVGAVSAVEIVLAVVVTVGFAILVIRLSARLYRGAVLRLGARVRLRDAWRSAGG